MQPITCDGLDHSHEEKSPEWYVLKWIIAVTIALVCMIFGNMLLGILVLVASFTLSILASKPVPVRRYIIDERGVQIQTEFFHYKDLRSYEFVDRGHDHLLVIDTTHTLNPHLLIPVDDDIVDDVRTTFDEYAKDVPQHKRGIPLSHTLMELIGL